MEVFAIHKKSDGKNNNNDKIVFIIIKWYDNIINYISNFEDLIRENTRMDFKQILKK